MSGIVGIVQQSAPIDRKLLEEMTDFLAFRGPDAQKTWCEGAVGFGHALLCTAREGRKERQPASLDGEVWITADARLDARTELIAELEAKGLPKLNGATQAQLILYAYQVWGDECVAHLLGDFVFAVWDGRRRRLFCARDHLGIKPFYYAHLGDLLAFSNSLNCLRLHPGVSDRLNDLTIADFLLFEENQDVTTTAFADIGRLPPAHILTWSEGALRVARYWTLPVDGPSHFGRASEYVEHFRELLRTAVADRTPDSVGVMMSGGLDSTTVAAAAKGVLAARALSFDLQAYAVVYDRLIPDQERHYTGLAAKALSIPVHFMALDRYELFERWDQWGVCSPEPAISPLAAISFDCLQAISANHRVVLTGFGGDPLLSTSLSAYFAKLLRQRKFGAAMAGLARYLTTEGRLSRLYLRTRLRILRSRFQRTGSYPPWLSRDLASRLDLPHRWKQLSDAESVDRALLEDAPRPEAYEATISPFWPSLFEDYDPGVSCVPLDFRHPFFDLRLLRFLLSLPALPWCADKQLLRTAMRGVFPDEIRLRRKSPAAGDAVVERMRRSRRCWKDLIAPSPQLANYVDWSRVPEPSGERDDEQLWVNLRAFSLNLWLNSSYLFRRTPERGGPSSVLLSYI